MINDPFGQLYGMYVVNLAVSDDQSALRVSHSDGHTYINTDADCCSETWFADIIGVENLLKYTVTGIQLLELPEPQDDRGRQEYDQAYGVRLTSKKGHCDIIYRNSSNGYYGGSACYMSKEDGEKRVWKEITEDWQA